MSDERYHLEISKKNIRSEKYEKTGGGNSFSRTNYTEHGKKLFNQTIKLKEIELSKKDSKLTNDLFFQIETPTTLSVKSEKFNIEKLGFEIINYSQENKSIGTAKINKENLIEFEKRLIAYTESNEHTGKTYFSVIEDISSIPPESKIKTNVDFNSNEEIPIIINLFNALSKKERSVINQSIIEEVKKYSNDVTLHNFSNGITSISCVLKAKEIPLIVNEFSTIKEIKLNHTNFIEHSMPFEKMPDSIEIKTPESNSAICIIDSGINNNNGIFNTIVREQKSMLPERAVECSYHHGTFVASRCVFGDKVENILTKAHLNPYCYLIDIQVFGVNSYGDPINPDEFHLRRVVEKVVIDYHETVRVYNLSFGGNTSINSYEFSDLAKLLDYLSKTHKVLFVLSSGNIDNLLGDFPVDHFMNTQSRICSPAESILSLTVGSIAKYSNDQSLSNSEELSPFSRIGPGADLGAKPELVAHGGNYIKPYDFFPRIATYGISSDGKHLAIGNGTSYSAPIISQYAQKLFDLYPNSDPNLVKALLCHFTEERNIHDELTNDLVNFVGFGEPLIEKAIKAGKNNAAYIYEGQLDQENYQFVTFHIPSSLASDEDTKLKVKITITYDPPVNPDNESEYSQTRISALLIKQTEDGTRPINISGDGTYSLPWNPIIQFEKSFTRSYLTGAWDLRLRLYTRGNVKDDYLQDYAVVIEIIDEKENTNVYNDIIEEFGNIYKKIEIKIAA